MSDQTDTPSISKDASNLGGDVGNLLGGDVGDLLKGEVITYIDNPTTEKWVLVPLYIETINGGMMVWQIGFDGAERLLIKHGHVNGSIQVKSRKVECNTSGRDIQQQALLEARHRYSKKYHEGYRPGGEELAEELKNCTPMLANEYWPGGYNEKKKKNMRCNVKKWPVAVMAKLDGIRSLVRKKEGGMTAESISMISRTRHNLVHTAEHFVHIRNELIKFFAYLPENSILDGELYSHQMNYNTIQSIVMTEKKIVSRHEEIKYHIFDIIEPKRLTFEARYLLLFNAYKKFVEDGNTANNFSLLSVTLAETPEDIIDFHNQYVEMGFEGLMIRHLAGPNPSKNELNLSIYRPTRCNNLLKYKHFIDEEGEIIRIESGKGTDENLAIFVIRDKENNELRIRPRGSFEERAKWFKEPNLVIGKVYTFRYFERSETGIPRMPTGKGFR